MPYQVHNAYNSVETRIKKYTKPTNDGRIQFILGQRRLVKGRSLIISDDELLSYIDELKACEACGLIRVTTMDGRPLDLETLQPKYEMKNSDPKPSFRPDLVEYDKPHGAVFDSTGGDLPPPEDFVMPVPPPDAALDAPVREVTPAIFDTKKVKRK